MSELLMHAMLAAAQLYAALNTDKPQVGMFTRWDGLQIPPSTIVRVTVELIHAPDSEVTPILEMEAVV